MKRQMGSPTFIAIVTVLCTGFVSSLRCWHCIAEDCDGEPSDNYKARKKSCNIGQSCQKVYFEMYDDNLKQQYTSTIRGCSAGCTIKNDFVNCTYQLRTTRGCVRKDCCQDNDLCNGCDVIRYNVQSACLAMVSIVTLVWRLRNYY